MIVSPEATASRILKLTAVRPTLGLVLGSGFQSIVDEFSVIKSIPFRKLPGFPPLGVPGHDARLLIAELEGVEIMVLCGRAHYYEGHSMDKVTFPIRVLANCGVRNLLLTNAAGGINPRFRPGDLMCVADHVNFMGVNPLRVEDRRSRSHFTDLTAVYDRRLRDLLLKASAKEGVRIHSGVYLAVSGPSFETPAEIRAFRRLGADAIGMSTVPEAIVAQDLKMKVAALSCITNAAAGRNRKPLSHAEVLETGKRSAEKIGRVIKSFVQMCGTNR